LNNTKRSKKSRFETLIEQYSREDIVEYLIEQNHTNSELYKYLGVGSTLGSKILNYYKIVRTEEQKKAAYSRVIRESRANRSPERRVEISRKHSEYMKNEPTEHKKAREEKANATRERLYGNSKYRGHDKAVQTFLNRYGVDNPRKSKEVREKIKETWIKKYGVDHPAKSDTIKQKMRQTCLDRYGVELFVLSSKFQPSLSFKVRNSKPNLQFAELLQESNLTFEREFSIRYGNRNCRFIYDFKVGDDILIEINPTFTHNSTIPLKNRKQALPANYHQIKYQVAKKSGYYCVHVFEWDDPQNIVHKILQNMVPVIEGEPQLHKVLMNKIEVDVWDAGQVTWIFRDQE
jgi:ribosomal protein L21E